MKLLAFAAALLAPAPALALSSTLWLGTTRIAWVMGARPAVVDPAMDIEMFARANPGHHVLMTVALNAR